MPSDFAEEMKERFKDLIHSNLFGKIGHADGFDFDSVLQHLRMWETVPNKEAALFSQDSRNWSNCLVAMGNETNRFIGTMDERRPIEDMMRNLVRELRPELNEIWEAFQAKSDVDPELLEGASLPGRFMYYAREVYISRSGHRVTGALSDLIRVFENGFLPCGWDGVYPNGDLLIY